MADNEKNIDRGERASCLHMVPTICGSFECETTTLLLFVRCCATFDVPVVAAVVWC